MNDGISRSGSRAVIAARTGTNPAIVKASLAAVSRSIFDRALRAWRRGLVIMLVGAALSFGATRVIKPTYRSETVLLYRESIRTAGDEDKDSGTTRAIGGKLREMLLARTKLEGIMSQFELYAKERAKDPVQAVDRFRNAITFRINENTFSLAYDAEERDLAQQVTVRLAEGLVEESGRLRRERAQATKEFLEAQKRRNDEELKVFEQRYAKFLSVHPEFVAVAIDPRGTGLLQARRSSLETKPGKLDAHSGARDAVETKKAGLRARLAAGNGPQPKTEELKNAETSLAEAESELKEAQRRFTENHPDVAAARTKVAQARGARDRARQNQPQPLSDNERAQLAAELNRLDRLSAIAAGPVKVRDGGVAGPESTALIQEGDLIVRTETEWAGVNRDVQEARERNKLLDDKLFRATIALNVETGTGAAQLIVVDPAYLPVQPTRNSRTRIVGVGGALSLVLALGLMLLAARADDRLYSASDVEALSVGSLTVTIARRPGKLSPKRSTG